MTRMNDEQAARLDRTCLQYVGRPYSHCSAAQLAGVVAAQHAEAHVLEHYIEMLEDRIRAAGGQP